MIAIPKEDVIRSEKYRRGAKDSPCRFRGPTCNCDPSTSQFAHANGADFGKGAMHKAHDVAGIDACSSCHAYIDVGHWTKPLINDAEFWRLIARGIVETIVARIRSGIVIIPLDPERLAHDKPVKPRKPKAERRPIHGRTEIQSQGFQPGHRPLRSRNNLRKDTP
jgi:hypothetical protein